MKTKVALIQMSCNENIDSNIEKTIGMVRSAAKSGAEVVCLQELYNAQYFPQTVDVKGYDIAKPLTDKSVTLMQELAKTEEIVLIVPVYEYAMEGVYFNSVVVIESNGEILGKYRKNHIPDGPQYHEKYYFTPGDMGYPIFETSKGKIAVGICWDEWFPEVARLFALQGAQMIFYPSAIGSEPDRPGYSSADAWKTVIRSHGIANNVFIGAVNRVGTEKDMSFYGHSFISGPGGDYKAEATTQDDEIILAEVDYSEIKEYRELLQFHRDRRVDTYSGLLKKVLL